MVKVSEIINKSEEKRWLVTNDDGVPILPIMRYVKYKDSLGKASNTLKTYCYHLKVYWEYLNKCNIDFKNVDLNTMAEFTNFLRYDGERSTVVFLADYEKVRMAKRSERTINQMLNCVVDFYDYLYRSQYCDIDLKSKVTQIVSGRKRYKGFLDHITPKAYTKNILRLKEPRRKIKTLTKDQIELIHQACKNIRDILLIRIMYEGGLRATELISLWIEDFNINENSITVRKSKTAAGENRKVYISKETMNLFQDYIIEFHTDEINTNFAFINLKGKNKGEPMHYWTLQNLVRRITQKTKIDFTAHMLRHSYATDLHSLGMDAAIIQKLLGHAHVQTTINMYIHPSEETILKSWKDVQSTKEGEKN